jgi:hypothetical protein
MEYKVKGNKISRQNSKHVTHIVCNFSRLVVLTHTPDITTYIYTQILPEIA